jgi:predicted nucleic acid-binding protein
MPKSWLCIDANLIVRLLASPQDISIRQFWEEWDDANQQLAAPTLLRYEVVNAFYRYEKQGTISRDAVHAALKAALALPIHYYGEAGLHVHALLLAERFSLPAAYDAHYLALAEQLGTELWTADKRLYHAVEQALPWVHYIQPT